jgi:hypothetical protein
MARTKWQVGAVAALFALAVVCGTRADDKPIDGGKAEKFKGKTFDLKAKGKVKIILTFPARTATITVRSEKESDVNLFIYDEDNKVVDKDDSPGPSCDIKFKPKAAGKYTLEIVNKGPGDNKSTLKVAFGKKKKKE